MEHFHMHKEADPEITFGRFIKMHYIGPYIITDDFNQDQQLPFRNAETHTMQVSVCECVLFSVEIDVPTPPAAEFYIYNEINQPQLSSLDIFQPPRVALQIFSFINIVQA